MPVFACLLASLSLFLLDKSFVAQAVLEFLMHLKLALNYGFPRLYLPNLGLKTYGTTMPNRKGFLQTSQLTKFFSEIKVKVWCATLRTCIQPC